jgi:hypothetical protein
MPNLFGARDFLQSFGAVARGGVDLEAAEVDVVECGKGRRGEVRRMPLREYLAGLGESMGDKEVRPLVEAMLKGETARVVGFVGVWWEVFIPEASRPVDDADAVPSPGL